MRPTRKTFSALISRRGDEERLVDLDASRLSVAERVHVDPHTAARNAVALASDSADAPPDPEIPSLLREELLPGRPEEWLLDAREHFRQTRLHALEAVSRRHRHQGRMCTALMYAMAAVEAEPLRESAHREITAVHLAEGNTTEALRHFEAYRRRLRGELGLPPSSGYRKLLSPCLGRPLDVRD